MSKVQEVLDAGREGTGGPSPAEARRLEQGPHEVELCGGGWAGPVGRVKGFFHMAPPAQRGTLQYMRIDIGAFVFNQVSAVLVLQGMTLQDLFPPDAHFINQLTRTVLARGPFILLRGKLSEGWDPPLRLTDVVLAALEAVPPDMTKEEVLAVLLREAL